MQLAWGQLPGVSVAEQLEDSLRARRFSERFADLVRSEAGERGALGILDNRLTTIGITENASAFNAQRRIAAEHIAERLGLVEIWDATLDKRTCDVCWSMNGEHAVIGVGFPGGMVPGLVHPRCRCTSHFDRIN